jgi:hypothetical protein
MMQNIYVRIGAVIASTALAVLLIPGVDDGVSVGRARGVKLARKSPGSLDG